MTSTRGNRQCSSQSIGNKRNKDVIKTVELKCVSGSHTQSQIKTQVAENRTETQTNAYWHFIGTYMNI